MKSERSQTKNEINPIDNAKLYLKIILDRRTLKVFLCMYLGAIITLAILYMAGWPIDLAFAAKSIFYITAFMIIVMGIHIVILLLLPPYVR